MSGGIRNMSSPSKDDPKAPGAPASRVLWVDCPTCGGKSLYAPENRFRPFCSERCRQIDLGAWAAEDFRMGTDAPQDEEGFGDHRSQRPQEH